jgi:hypothetical protein
MGRTTDLGTVFHSKIPHDRSGGNFKKRAKALGVVVGLHRVWGAALAASNR